MKGTIMANLNEPDSSLIITGLESADELLFTDPDLLLSEYSLMDVVNHAIPAMTFPKRAHRRKEK